MKTARVVIGANFGDEGKGVVTDYLCSQGAGMVVRFNGGAQAGHTVVTPEGRRHVFSHFGAGTFANVPTYLSKFFLVNPIMFLKEREKLAYATVVYAHPSCQVTTFADMIINQTRENVRATRDGGRHGSVGLGIHETQVRPPHLRITMSDLWNRVSIKDRLKEICGTYAQFRMGHPIANREPMIEAFIECCEEAAQHIHPLGMHQIKDPVFEGAQGLLLDQSNKEFYPHVTHSNTGMKNVRVLAKDGGIERLKVYYVSRTYLTRHGAGPLPGEDPNMKFDDDTNVVHKFQGEIRFAPLDYAALVTRCATDFGGIGFKLVLTHCDQLAAPAKTIADMHWFGPTRDHIGVKSRLLKQ